VSAHLDWLLLGIAAVLSAGCDSGPKRIHLSGQIAFNGKPVPAGEIYFDPDAKKGKDGPQGFARIRDGRYDTRETHKALTAGPHVVRIFGFDGQARPSEELPFGKPLFVEHTTAADVPDGGGTLDFQVPVRGLAR
jgi:hypothetical protein